MDRLYDIINKLNLPQEDRNYLYNNIKTKDNNTDNNIDNNIDNKSYNIFIEEFPYYNWESKYTVNIDLANNINDFNNKFNTNFTNLDDARKWFFDNYNIITINNVPIFGLISDVILYKSFNSPDRTTYIGQFVNSSNIVDWSMIWIINLINKNNTSLKFELVNYPNPLNI